MHTKTRERAYQMLREERLMFHQHLQQVYVVGEKIFAFAYAAEAWKKEVASALPIEVVRIAEAYGVNSITDLPEGVEVNFRIH